MSDFTGTYTLTINTPMGKQEGTLTLAQDGSSLTGSMSAQGESVDISNGSVEGDAASWDVAVSKPMPMTLGFSASKTDSGVSGKVKLGAFGEADWEGVSA